MINKTSSVNLNTAKNLKCYVITGKVKWCQPEYQHIYDRAYRLWKKVIKEGLISVGMPDEAENLTSDAFLLQDEATCLFSENDTVGLFMFRWVSLDFAANRDQQYFKTYYPSHVLKSLYQAGHRRIMIMSQLMVDKGWRKNKIGCCVSEILVDLAIKRFLESSSSVLITFTRNNRKTNELGYRHGANPLLQKHIAHGTEADILAVYRQNARLTNIPGVAKVSEKLWEQKIVTYNYEVPVEA